jgi:hypothetical protein
VSNPAIILPQGIAIMIANFKILFFSIYKIIERQGQTELPIGILWLRNHGIRIPKNMDYLNIVEQFMNSKLLDVLNNEFWIVHVILGVLLAISYPLLIKFIDWKR